MSFLQFVIAAVGVANAYYFVGNVYRGEYVFALISLFCVFLMANTYNTLRNLKKKDPDE